MATHSNILAGKIPWTESQAGYSPWGCERVGHDLVTKQRSSYNRYETKEIEDNVFSLR